MSEAKQRVAVLGASTNPERYSNKAILRLLENGHEVVPVHPALDEVEGLKVVPNLAAIGGAVDTLTMYVSPKLSAKMTDAILALKPGRVIFNPGTENAELESALNDAGIGTLQACTLVLLATGQF
ncbi:MAG: CoA-binding protein [Thermoanaerobaculales bacterium]|jgi:predicted CoA-binding protein|nr:CoA-binding protein [Thermoanaerobaculales bacterium]